MNGKPDWIVRGLLVLIAILLVVNIFVSPILQSGRYVPYESFEDVAIVDTRTGKIYIQTWSPPGLRREFQKSSVHVMDMLERAKTKE